MAAKVEGELALVWAGISWLGARDWLAILGLLAVWARFDKNKKQNKKGGKYATTNYCD